MQLLERKTITFLIYDKDKAERMKEQRGDWLATEIDTFEVEEKTFRCNKDAIPKDIWGNDGIESLCFFAVQECVHIERMKGDPKRNLLVGNADFVVAGHRHGYLHRRFALVAVYRVTVEIIG